MRGLPLDWAKASKKSRRLTTKELSGGLNVLLGLFPPGLP
jgi:hypothetical protein